MVVLTEKNAAAIILTRFNKIVLSWDYFSLLPNLKDKKKKLKISKEDAKKLGLKKVKKSYKTVDDYIKTFEPLLFEEVKAQIIQGKSKDDDDDVGVSKFGCISSYTEADGFHLPMVVFEAEEDDRIAENDLLLVTEHQVAGLSTIIREYVALMSVSSLPFKDLILSAAEKDATSEHRPWKIPRPLMQSLENNHNSSQLDAIRVEGATLIPLANGCKQVFLVRFLLILLPIIDLYGMSLFSRFQEAGYPVQMLKTQYRMHPQIREFPSEEFYSGALQDGEDVNEQTIRPWHDFKCFGPFCFFDIEDGIESESEDTDQSKVNFDEVEFVLLMYHKLVKNYPKLKSSSQLAIITPYAKQMKLFRDHVAVFSCVRANKEGKIGFLGNFRRMNVGITSARSSVLVVGSASTLKKDKHWNSLVESARARGCLFKVKKPYPSYFNDENLESMKVAESQLERMEGHMNDMENNANMDVNPMVEDVDQGNVDDEDGGDGDGGDGNDD
ncbi:hypothetical protein MKW92_002989 [Papaver armeniacum]|nr:hypothetical protein MKW92_002989 [Papaver armeniacum]